jgi:hypothetical protein
MYMRVRHLQVDSSWDPARFDEFSQLNREVAAIIKQLPGCESVTIGGDPTTGEAYVVSTYDTEDHAGWSDALGDLGSRLYALGVQPGPHKIFEVLAS